MKNLVNQYSQQKQEIVEKLQSVFLPFLLLCLSLSIIPLTTKAEGTRQVAPTPADFVMLETNNPDFGNFASFDGPAESRLFISILCELCPGMARAALIREVSGPR